MIERLGGMPPGTLGFRATGEIEDDDYEDVLVPALREALEAGGGLRTLYLIEDLEEIEPGALWADTKLGIDVGIRHHGAWVRSAIVTDIDWMARAARMFAWMVPGEARVFGRDELEQAKAWIAEGGI
jgi:SpoIIAA-like